MTSMPTLILVHGAYHRRTAWNLVLGELADLDVRAVQLPSSAPVAISALGDMYDDARAVREAVQSVGGPVVVCAHSYGAVPVSEGLAHVDEVERIVYLNAFLLDVGETMLGNRGGAYPPHWDVHEAENYVLMKDAERVLYDDLAPRAAREAADALGPHSLRSLTQPLTQAAWHTVANTYVIGGQDNGMPLAMREKFAGRAQFTLPFSVPPAGDRADAAQGVGDGGSWLKPRGAVPGAVLAPGHSCVGTPTGYFAGPMVGKTSEARPMTWLSISKLNRAALVLAPSPVVDSFRAVMVM